MDKLKQIGTPPWAREELIESLAAFEEVYARRPLPDNQGGMLAPHAFAVWFLAGKLKPETILESGVWRGQGTWLLEQACPEARRHAIDLNLDKRVYISDQVTYHDEDFSALDWSELDPDRTLVFFDDHQNAYQRLMHCRWFGFKHVLFEDNYPPGEGDFYSLKQAFAGSGFGPAAAGEASKKYRKWTSKAGRRLLSTAIQWGAKGLHAIPQYNRLHVVPNRFDADCLEKNLETYAEFPPVFKPPLASSIPTPDSLLPDTDRERHPVFFEERSGYNWLCYAHLK